MQKKSVSLIVTTYNWPAALELVLSSIVTQSELPDEVIIADDGSRDGTRQLIERFQTSFPVPLIHSWQEDIGFRAARSRNLAIAKAKNDYIVMIDGDILLHQDFIRDHKRSAKQNYFVQGRRVILTKEFTEELFRTKQYSISLFSSHVKNKANAISCPILSKIITPLLSKKDHRSARSANFAAWRSDIININGFNEDFTGWGREDSEFVVRLLNSGILRQDLRFGGVGYHLYHNENTRHNLTANDQILEQTIINRVTYCNNGLASHLSTTNGESNA